MDAGAPLSIAPILFGSGNLTKVGTGTLTLSGANTYTGATTISVGTLKIGHKNTNSTYSGGISSITFGSGFSIANLLGIAWDDLTLNTPYTILAGLDNFGSTQATAVGNNGSQAYFTNGSLAVIVIPECPAPPCLVA